MEQAVMMDFPSSWRVEAGDRNPLHDLQPGESTRGRVINTLASLKFGARKVKLGRMGENIQSGRWDSNPRRPAWEAGILPLNYARSRYSQ